MGFLEIFDVRLEILNGVQEILDVCSGDIRWMSWSYLMDVLELLDRCLGGF